jgi:streptogramin lyase
MRNLKILAFAGPLFALVLATTVGVPSVFSQHDQGRIRGSMTSVDGKPIEGVAVSVRGQNEPYVTTVFTNERGVYVFPPLGNDTKYSLWAQAQGFQTAKADAVPGKEVPALQLKPLEDISKQLTGVEWMNSFPENTPEEKRAKRIFANNCSGCHDEHFALQNRFDADGWSKIVTVMSKSSEGTTLNPNAPGLASMNEYKDEIVAFLTKVRGPAPANYPLKPLPRPTGEAAQAVITEYDTPRPEAPAEYLMHNGSDWMEGTPSRWEGRSTHSTAVGGDGRVYFSDDRSMYATLHELDPKTGIVTNLIFPYKDGVMATHGIATDADGNIWATAAGDFLEFNVKSQQFNDFPRPPDMKASVGGTLDADRLAFKGMVWATSGTGAIKIDGKTGQYTFFPNPTSKGTYGITVDRHGNGWYSSPQGDKVYVVDAETGETSAIGFPPQGTENGMAVLEKDKQAYANVKAGADDANAIQVCPRRMGADPNADVVWVALFCSDKIARIDTQTHQITQYAMPYKYSRPYAAQVDRDHNVWINETNTDMIAKFNPTTQKFTEYQLPTRGTDVRNIAFDYSTNSLIVYMPYSRENKVARLQFRKPFDMK